MRMGGPAAAPTGLAVLTGLTGVLLVAAGVLALQAGAPSYTGGGTGTEAGAEVSAGHGLSAPAQGRGLRAGRVPAPVERATRTPSGDISIPVRILSSGRATLVMVPVQVNGRGPYEFVLDTGASTSTVDRALADRLRLPRTGETARVRGVTGEAVVPLIRLRSWTLGGRALQARTLTVTNMGQPGVFGLLGSDELRRFGRITVDYRHRRLILSEPANSGNKG